MTTKTANRSELHGAAAASHEKAQQNKDIGKKGEAKPVAPTKIPAGAGSKSNPKRTK